MAEPDVLPEVLERFLDHPVARPPLDELRALGDAEVRRRRRRGVVASCAAVLVIAGSVVAGQTLFRPDDDRAPAESTSEVAAQPDPGPVDLTIIGRSDGLGNALVYRHPAEMAADHSVVVAGEVVGFADGYEVLERGTAREGYDVRDYTVVMRVRVTELYKGSGDDLDAEGSIYLSLSRGATQEGVENDEGGPSTITPIEDFERAIPVGSEVVVMASPVILPEGPATEIVEPQRGVPVGSNLLAAGHPQSLTFATPDGETTAWRSESMADVRHALEQHFADAPNGAVECPTNQISSGDIDVTPPTSPEEAREQGWPRTAGEAVQNSADAPAFAGFGEVTLDDGVVRGPGRVDFTLADTEGDVVAILTVEELVEDAWAMTAYERCAGR